MEIFTTDITDFADKDWMVQSLETRLQCSDVPITLCAVGVPNVPVNLTAEQVTELNKKLSHMRHEVNNQLALVVAALELIRYRPDMRDKMLDTVAQQTPKITAEIMQFSEAFDSAFGITRD